MRAWRGENWELAGRGRRECLEPCSQYTNIRVYSMCVLWTPVESGVQNMEDPDSGRGLELEHTDESQRCVRWVALDRCVAETDATNSVCSLFLCAASGAAVLQATNRAFLCSLLWICTSNTHELSLSTFIQTDDPSRLHASPNYMNITLRIYNYTTCIIILYYQFMRCQYVPIWMETRFLSKKLLYWHFHIQNWDKPLACGVFP